MFIKNFNLNNNKIKTTIFAKKIFIKNNQLKLMNFISYN